MGNPLWQIANKIRSYDPESGTAVDKEMAENLTDLDSLIGIRYYVSNSSLPGFMPKTKEKINFILRQNLDNDGVKDFSCWMDKETGRYFADQWLKDDDLNCRIYYSTRRLLINSADQDIGLKILERMVERYKKRKLITNYDVLKDVFRGLKSEDVEKGCELLSGSTPAVIACLLEREDLPEKYLVKALRSLGKLSGQKKIAVKFDFSKLEHLGPHARLNAMQQLFGMYDKYYKRMERNKDSNGYYYSSSKDSYEKYGVQKDMPFKEVPSQEEVEKFLFPCCIKYNEEVINLVARYKRLIARISQNQGGGKDESQRV